MISQEMCQQLKYIPALIGARLKREGVHVIMFDLLPTNGVGASVSSLHSIACKQSTSSDAIWSKYVEFHVNLCVENSSKADAYSSAPDHSYGPD